LSSFYFRFTFWLSFWCFFAVLTSFHSVYVRVRFLYSFGFSTSAIVCLTRPLFNIVLVICRELCDTFVEFETLFSVVD